MYTVNSWVSACVLSLQVSLFPWWVMWGLVTTLSALAIRWLPGVRMRRIFASPAPGIWRWVSGEYSLPATTGWGVAGMSGVGWGCSALGAWPLSSWGGALLSMVSLMVAVALMNAGRKSRLPGAGCLTLSCVVGGTGTFGLWVGMVWIGWTLGLT